MSAQRLPSKGEALLQSESDADERSLLSIAAQLEALLAAPPLRQAPMATPQRSTIATPRSTMRVSPAVRAASKAASEAADAAQLQEELTRARRKFDELDEDGSGTLDREEVGNLSKWALQGFLETKATTVRLTPAQQEAETERLMAQADTDGDGVLTFEEFEAWFTPTCREIQQLSRGKDVMRKQRNAQKRR